MRKFIRINAYFGKDTAAAARNGYRTDRTCGDIAEGHEVIDILAVVAAVGAERLFTAAIVEFIAKNESLLRIIKETHIEIEELMANNFHIDNVRVAELEGTVIAVHISHMVIADEVYA